MSLQYITPELFEKLVGLAALELSEEERTYLFEEMNHQLASVESLRQIQIPEGVAPSLHGLIPEGISPRADEWKAFAKPEQIVELAPESEEGMIAVPDVKGAK
ncbi:MAG: Asp-tRNA(Asn)/Glu-tRNA(Gln) amidotransferase subunit GatC [Anaerolineaceae bacterium]|jgi:aspartyl/glutamyl-tRNA(Asn/Gln) amidotransferase C subunit